MKLIPLTQGRDAIVDDADYEWLRQWKWTLTPRGDRRVGYAYRQEYLGNGKYRTILMHRAILGVVDEPDVVTDHRSGFGLDNQRSNLRACTHLQNARNQRKCTSSTSSRYKGVSWRRRDNRWEARLKVCGRLLFLGLYFDEADAAEAYNAAALRHFGEYARLNQISRAA